MDSPNKRFFHKNEVVGSPAGGAPPACKYRCNLMVANMWHSEHVMNVIKIFSCNAVKIYPGGK